MSGDFEWPEGQRARRPLHVHPPFSSHAEGRRSTITSPSGGQPYSRPSISTHSNFSPPLPGSGPDKTMFGSSIPPQPAPFPQQAFPHYMNELSQQDQRSALAFENLAQRQQEQAHPNYQGLNANNLGGNVSGNDLWAQYLGANLPERLPPHAFLPGPSSYPGQTASAYTTPSPPSYRSGNPNAIPGNPFINPSLYFSQETNTAALLPHDAGFPDPSVLSGQHGSQVSSSATPVPYRSRQSGVNAEAGNGSGPSQQAYGGASPSLMPEGSMGGTASPWASSDGYYPDQYEGLVPMTVASDGFADNGYSPPMSRPQPTAVQTSDSDPATLYTSSFGSSDSSSSLSIPLAHQAEPQRHGPRGHPSAPGHNKHHQHQNGRKRQKVGGDGITQGMQGVHLGEQGDSGDESDQGVGHLGGGGRSVVSNGEQKKTSGACTHCKRLKMKCEFEPGQAKCNRCVGKPQECRVEGRKQRQKSTWRETLNQQIREKDRTIQFLLKQLHNPWQVTPFHATSPVAITGDRKPSVSATRDEKDLQAWAAQVEAARKTADSKSSPLIDRTMRLKLMSDGEANSDDEEPLDQMDDDASITKSPTTATTELLPVRDSPFGLLADMGVQANRGNGSVVSDQGDQEAVGLANNQFFAPGPAVNAGLRRRIIELQTPPEITERRIVTPEEVHKLFGLFYERLNPVLAIFDPDIHTPAHVYGRCPFLFTVVCAIASRYYRERPELYSVAMHLARTSAATSLINGWKSVEICQAYILLSVYSLPAKRWEEDRAWLYLGLAIRMATDLNLHVPQTIKSADEAQEREILNRSRTWLICFNLDRSAATQLGRPTSIREDFLIRHSGSFYKCSKYNHPFDIHLCAYTALLRIMARFLETVYSDPNTPTGLNKNIDWLRVSKTFDQELQAYHKDTAARFAVESSKTDPACQYRVELLPFLCEYSRLVLWSFGFQQAFEKKMETHELADFFHNSYDAAYQLVHIVVDKLAKTDYFSYAPDGYFVFIAFASAFLLKLLRPEFATLLAEGQQMQIMNMITSVVDVFNNVALDNMHTPRLYARFLQTLVERRLVIEEQEAAQLAAADHPPPSGEPAEVTAKSEAASDIHETTYGESLQPNDVHHFVPNHYDGGVPRSSTPIPTVVVEGSLSGAVSTVGDETEIPGGSTYGGSLFNLDDMDDEMGLLASMNALTDPAFSDTMMLPGFRWPIDNGMDWLNNFNQPEQNPADMMSSMDTFSYTNVNTPR